MSGCTGTGSGSRRAPGSRIEPLPKNSSCFAASCTVILYLEKYDLYDSFWFISKSDLSLPGVSRSNTWLTGLERSAWPRSFLFLTKLAN